MKLFRAVGGFVDDNLGLVVMWLAFLVAAAIELTTTPWLAFFFS